jgi:hypothetical protein
MFVFTAQLCCWHFRRPLEIDGGGGGGKLHNNAYFIEHIMQNLLQPWVGAPLFVPYGPANLHTKGEDANSLVFL